MRVCEHAKPTGKPCNGGYSKLVTCEKDSIIRCLRDCMPGCPQYKEKAGVETAVRRQKAVGGISVSSKPSVKSSGGCGSPVPCGKNAPPQEVQNRSW